MFMKCLRQNEKLQGTCRSPLLLLILLISGYANLNESEISKSLLYRKLISSLISSYNEKHPYAELDAEPEIWMQTDAFQRLAVLASDKLVEGRKGILSFTEKDLQAYKVDQIWVRIGVLTMEEDWSNQRRRMIYFFLHKAIQEFFAENRN